MKKINEKLNKTTEINSDLLTNKLRLGTAFSGMGCAEYALKTIGVNYTSEFAIDWNSHCRETIKRNYMPKQVFGDITKVKSEELNECDLYVWGSSCQDFSTSNNNRTGLKGTKSSVFFDGYRILKETQPKYSIFENVGGITSSNNGKDFELVLKLFKELNYDVYVKKINPVDIGGNTTRIRIFVILIRKDIGITYNFPEETGSKSCIKDCLIEGEYPYLDEKDFQPWEKTVQEQRGKLRKTHKYTAVSRLERQRVYDINYHCPTIQTDGKVLINDGKGFRYLSNEELKRIQGFGDDLDMSHLSSTQMKSQLGNTMEVETMKKLLGEIVRINNLYNQKKSANNIDFKPKSKRGRPLKKTVITNNHIAIVRKFVNNPDMNYLNLTEDRINEYSKHLKNGGTISVVIEKYKSLKDKSKGKIEKEVIIPITKLEKLGFRDRKNLIYRVKITGTELVKEKVAKSHVLFTRPGGKGKFESKFETVHTHLGVDTTKVDTVIDALFGGGGYSLKNIEKLNFNRFIINDLDPLIIKTMTAVKKNPSKVISIYQKLDSDYQDMIPDALRYYTSKIDKRKDKKLKKLRLKHNYLKEYYQDLLSKLDNHKFLDIYTVAAYYIFTTKQTTSGFIKYYEDGTLVKDSFNHKYDENDKTKMIKHWSYLLNKYNVEIRNECIFELLKDRSIDNSNSLIYLDPPYVGVKFIYDADNSEDFQLKLLRETQDFKYRIYSNEDCKELYELAIDKHFSYTMTFERKSNLGSTNTNGKEFLACNTSEDLITQINNTNYKPEQKKCA